MYNVSHCINLNIHYLHTSLPLPSHRKLSSPMELPLLQRPKQPKTDRRKRKCKLKPHITPITRIPNLLAYRADKPHLRHTHHCPKHSEAESEDGGHSWWEEFGVVPDGDVVFAFFEDEVFG